MPKKQVSASEVLKRNEQTSSGLIKNSTIETKTWSEFIDQEGMFLNINQQ